MQYRLNVDRDSVSRVGPSDTVTVCDENTYIMAVHTYTLCRLIAILWVTSQSNGEYNICVILYYG